MLDLRWLDLPVAADPDVRRRLPVMSRTRFGRNGRGAVFAVWTEYVCVNDLDHLPEDWKPR